jgi:dTDP-4-dehydrorhamnose 3,5-epimerase
MIKDVIVTKLVNHEDHRGFFREVFRFPADFSGESIAQMSHSLVNEGIVKAWHGHRSQSQWTYVVSGVAQVALFDNRAESKSYMEIQQFDVRPSSEPVGYFFPCGVLHGYKCIQGPMHIIYVTSELYDPKGEIRIPADDPKVGFSWTQKERPKSSKSNNAGIA